MPQCESTEPSLSPRGVDPSPPSSPRLIGTRERKSAGKKSQTAKVAPTTNDVAAEVNPSADTEESPKARPTGQKQTPLPKFTAELADVEESLTLKTWKKALSLVEGRCGAINTHSQVNERCENKVLSKKTAGIDQLVEMLRRPNESQAHIEMQ